MARSRRRPAAIAETLRDAPDQAIVWGERLWREPRGRRRAARLRRTRSTCTSGSARACSRSPRSRTRAGCARPAACLAPSPGWCRIDGGRGSAQIKDGLAAHELGALLLVNADPGSHLPGLRRLAQGPGGQLRRLDRLLRGRVDPARQPRHPRRDLGREGGNGHPSRGPAAAPAPQRPAARGHDRRLALPRRGRGGARRRRRRRGSCGCLRRAHRRGPVLRGTDLRGDRRDGHALG